jgi:hypothetical protein
MTVATKVATKVEGGTRFRWSPKTVENTGGEQGVGQPPCTIDATDAIDAIERRRGIDKRQRTGDGESIGVKALEQERR